MREINNMGGILFADILYKNEISLFAVHQNTACIQIIKGHDWHRLPTVVSLISYCYLERISGRNYI